MSSHYSSRWSCSSLLCTIVRLARTVASETSTAAALAAANLGDRSRDIISPPLSVPQILQSKTHGSPKHRSADATSARCLEKPVVHGPLASRSQSGPCLWSERLLIEPIKPSFRIVRSLKFLFILDFSFAILALSHHMSPHLPQPRRSCACYRALG